MTEPKGPVFEGNIEQFAVTEAGQTYRILYLPDKMNAELQREGKSPHFYWLPASVRLAQDANGHFKFGLMKFAGIMSEDTHVGVEGDVSLAGGRLSLTTTARPPDDVLQKSHDQLREKYRGKDDRYWGIRTDRSPEFGVVPVGSNQTSISNISPQSDGHVPAIPPAGGNGDSPPGDQRSGGKRNKSTTRHRERERESEQGSELSSYPPGTNDAGEGDGTDSDAVAEETAAPGTESRRPRGTVTGPEPPSRSFIDTPQMVPQENGTSQRSGLDMWYERMDGEGPGSIDPGGENAFTATLGSIPTAILWQGFHGQYSPISVTQWMKLKVWSENIHLKITGDWERIHDEISTHVGGGYKFFGADIKAELSRLITKGTIKVELSVDGTTPSGAKHMEAIQKRMDLILDKFMKQAEGMIFRPPEKSEPAEAPKSAWSIFSPYSVGFALKAKRDITEVKLEYEETISERYLLDHVISSTLEGFYQQIKDDPSAADRYFSELHLDDINRKVQRIATPVVRYEDKAKQWVGEPVKFMSVQYGYPDTRGDLMWRGHVFDEGNETPRKFEFTRKDMDDVMNPPEDWEPDKAFVKRRVHFKEPPGPADYPYSTVEIEKEIAELDEGERGTLTSDIAQEVRADNAGKLQAGPMFLNVELENSKQYVEVAFKADGTNEAGQERSWTRFAWNYEGQDEPRYWMLFTGDPSYYPSFKYKVRVVVKGSIFSAGQEWVGPEQTVQGNGPVMISVPTPEEAVDTRSLSAREAAGFEDLTAEQVEVAERAAKARSESDDASVAPPTGRRTMTELVESSDDEGQDNTATEDDSTDRGPFEFSKTRGWNIR